MNPSAQSRRTQPACSSAALSDAIVDELRRYDDHLHDVHGLAASTRRNHCRIVGLLLQKKYAGGVIDMARLHAADVRRFIARQLGDSPSHSAAAQVATALRSYLRYRTICSDSVAPGALHAENASHTRGSSGSIFPSQAGNRRR